MIQAINKDWDVEFIHVGNILQSFKLFEFRGGVTPKEGETIVFDTDVYKVKEVSYDFVTHTIIYHLILL